MNTRNVFYLVLLLFLSALFIHRASVFVPLSLAVAKFYLLLPLQYFLRTFSVILGFCKVAHYHLLCFAMITGSK